MINIHVISMALAPITHMSGVSGNAALLKRETLVGADGSIERIPCLSGNAIRHAIVRYPAADYLFSALGLKNVSYKLADFFFHGGKLTKNSPLSTEKTKEFIDMLPFVGLLGGAMPGQILEGALRVSRGLLICKESANIISGLSGIEVHVEKGCECFVSPYTYTRSVPSNDPDAVQDRMIYEGETVISGAKFYHKFMIDSDDPLLAGCLIHALKTSDREIGGMGRIGHGELSVAWSSKDIDDENELISMYKNHVTSNAKKINDTLSMIFDNDINSKTTKKTTKKSKKQDTDNDTFPHDPFIDL